MNTPVVAIASKNGLEATRLAVQQMTSGVDTLEAVVAGVGLVEDDPDDTSVGFGGLPNENGVVELDAAVMHGPTHAAGAVAGLRGVRHASRVALHVLHRSDHVLIAGQGAAEFARAHGFASEDLLSDKARRIWLHWKETLSDRQDWLPPAVTGLHPDVIEFFKIDVGETTGPDNPDTENVGRFGPDYHRPTGTIHCAGRNDVGEISCTTSTSGLAFKRSGRVGDSPIVGAGLYVDNKVGSCGSTGRGEANLTELGSFAVVERMRTGLAPDEAAHDVLQQVIARTPPRLLDERGRPTYNLAFYVLAADGRHAGVSLWGPTPYAVTDAGGTRLEDCQALFTREETRP
ncbi:MAG TPA: asparaginase [Planctomycetaceae bacterium]|nr:asparaginase [Planctomycetaceae bacterium]